MIRRGVPVRGRWSEPAVPDDRVDVLGCAIDRLTFADTLARCDAAIAAGAFLHQVSMNAAKVVTVRRDPELRAIVERAGLVNADGVSVVWASRLLGQGLPERVTGIDLMHGLVDLAASRGYAIYIIGARPATLERAVSRLSAQHPRLRIAGYRDGYFAPSEVADVCAEIRATEPRIVFAAMGSPRTERWLGTHGRELGAALVMGVGGTIDVIAGDARRAPATIQRLGLEWLFRLLQEPRRLARRNLTSVTFWRLVVGELLARRRAGRM